MTWNLLSVGGELAAILTALFAGGTSIWYFRQRAIRRSKLQKYLVLQRKLSEAPGGQGSGARSIIHLMGNCSMTEAQVLEAAFGNKNITSWITADDDGVANGLMFRIDDRAWPKLKNSN